MLRTVVPDVPYRSPEENSGVQLPGSESESMFAAVGITHVTDCFFCPHLFTKGEWRNCRIANVDRIQRPTPRTSLNTPAFPFPHVSSSPSFRSCFLSLFALELVYVVPVARDAAVLPVRPSMGAAEEGHSSSDLDGVPEQEVRVHPPFTPASFAVRMDSVRFGSIPFESVRFDLLCSAWLGQGSGAVPFFLVLGSS